RRLLGVTGAKRVTAIPDVPTVGETVPGYEVSIWYGMAAPRGTPPEIVEKLNQAMNAVLADPKLQARLADLGGEPIRGSRWNPSRMEVFGKDRPPKDSPFMRRAPRWRFIPNIGGDAA